jgi:DNA-binding NarL/FixJ family response regulator
MSDADGGNGGNAGDLDGRREHRDADERGRDAGCFVRVLIVDDDALVRTGLRLMLDGARGIAVVGEAADGDEVLAAVDRHRPDVVLLDLRMPRVNGITALRRLQARAGRGGERGWAREQGDELSQPSAVTRVEVPRVIVLTTFDSDQNVLQALRAGAAGFLLKDTPPALIADAVLTVAAGDPMLSPQITRRLMDRVAGAADAAELARGRLGSLTPRERDVVLALARGGANADIAAALEMSVTTVKAHVSRILEKLELANRTQLALLAHDAGVL